MRNFYKAVIIFSAVVYFALILGGGIFLWLKLLEYGDIAFVFGSVKILL